MALLFLYALGPGTSKVKKGIIRIIQSALYVNVKFVTYNTPALKNRPLCRLLGGKGRKVAPGDWENYLRH
jgi:hypothetical protein